MEIKCERGQPRSLPMASATTASSPCDVETEDNLQFWSGMVALLARATVYDLGIAGTGARILGFIAIGSGLNIVKLLPNEKSDNSANDTTWMQRAHEAPRCRVRSKRSVRKLVHLLLRHATGRPNWL